MMLLLMLGCQGVETPPPAEASSDEETLENLRTLGYVDVAEHIADPTESGVQPLDAAMVQPGYRLVVTAKECTAQLLRAEDGEVVRSWSGSRRCYNWSNAELDDQGRLFVPERHHRLPWDWQRDDELKYLWSLRRYDTAGRQDRRFDLSAHHDVHPQPDGSLYTLVTTLRHAPLMDERANAWLLDDEITRLSADGEVLGVISLYDAMLAADLSVRKVRSDKELADRVTLDALHSNAIQVIPELGLPSEHPLSRPGGLLVTSRNQSMVMLIDPDSQKVVWSWGKGKLDGPHDGQLLDNGNVLVFDNGQRRKWSRVLEIEPISGDVVWSYGVQEDEPGHFYTKGRGSAQRLPNGNTLVANSNEGEAFEVTPAGQIVWRYFNPVLDKGRRASIVRMRHYPAELVDSW